MDTSTPTCFACRTAIKDSAERHYVYNSRWRDSIHTHCRSVLQPAIRVNPRLLATIYSTARPSFDVDATSKDVVERTFHSLLRWFSDQTAKEGDCFTELLEKISNLIPELRSLIASELQPCAFYSIAACLYHIPPGLQQLRPETARTYSETLNLDQSDKIRLSFLELFGRLYVSRITQSPGCVSSGMLLGESVLISIDRFGCRAVAMPIVTAPWYRRIPLPCEFQAVYQGLTLRDLRPVYPGSFSERCLWDTQEPPTIAVPIFPPFAVKGGYYVTPLRMCYSPSPQEVAAIGMSCNDEGSVALNLWGKDQHWGAPAACGRLNFLFPLWRSEGLHKIYIRTNHAPLYSNCLVVTTTADRVFHSGPFINSLRQSKSQFLEVFDASQNALNGVSVSAHIKNELPVLAIATMSPPKQPMSPSQVYLWPRTSQAPKHLPGRNISTFLSEDIFPPHSKVFYRTAPNRGSSSRGHGILCHGLHFVSEDGVLSHSVGQWHAEDSIGELVGGGCGFGVLNEAGYNVRINATYTSDMGSEWNWINPDDTLRWWTGMWGDYCDVHKGELL